MRAGIEIVAWIGMLLIPASEADSATSKWRSLGPDGGASWSASSSGLRSAALGISSVVIDSQSPGVLYAATDEGSAGVEQASDYA